MALSKRQIAALKRAVAYPRNFPKTNTVETSYVFARWGKVFGVLKRAGVISKEEK